MTNTAPTPFALGDRVLLGGSVGTITVVGTIHRDGVPTPVVVVACPDYGPENIRLVGNALYSIGPLAD